MVYFSFLLRTLDIIERGEAMKLTEQMELKGICVGVTLKEKDGVIDILAALQQKCGNTEQPKQLKREIYYREEEASSAMGAGVAICNLKSSVVRRALITAITAPAGVDLDAPDGEAGKLIFLVVTPPDFSGDPATRLSVLLMNENLREQLIHAADEQTFLQLLKLAEEGEYAAAPQRETPLLLVVLDGRTEGAADAAAALQVAAGRTGRLLKIEVHGTEEEVQPFSQEELQLAEGVILIGAGLGSERFNGKAILAASVTDGIHRPEHLLQEVKQAPIYYKPRVRKKRRWWAGWASFMRF